MGTRHWWCTALKPPALQSAKKNSETESDTQLLYLQGIRRIYHLGSIFMVRIHTMGSLSYSYRCSQLWPQPLLQRVSHHHDERKEEDVTAQDLSSSMKLDYAILRTEPKGM